jgi:hypothetical protein
MSDIKAGFVWSDKAENFANNKAMALRLNRTISEATVNLDEVLGWINVKDYGAVGDGVTDDSTAVAAAIAALTDYSVLYFPPGVYIASGTGQLNNLSHVTVMGAGMGVSVWKAPATGTTGDIMIWANGTGCNGWNVFDITLDGNNGARNGNHGLYLECSDLVIDHVEILNSGEFAIIVEDPDNAQNEFRNVSITNCRIIDSYADGIHVAEGANVVIANNLIDGADDDLIAVFDTVDCVIANNVCRARDDLGTTWGRGIAVLYGCERVMVTGNVVSKSKQSGILVAAEDSGRRPSNIQLFGNLITGEVGTSSGYGVRITDAENVTCNENSINDIAAGYGYLVGLFDNVAIKGGTIRETGNGFFRAIGIDETAGGTLWDGLSIENITIEIPFGGNEAVYMAPGGGQSSLRMQNLRILNLTVHSHNGSYIVYNQTSECVGRLTLTNGGSGYSTAPTVSFSGGGGSGATAVATINGSGVVDSVLITDPGKNYTSAPTVSFSGGGGSGAAATAYISKNKIGNNTHSSGATITQGYGSAVGPAATLFNNN